MKIKALLYICAVLLIVEPVFSFEFKRASTFEDAYKATCRVNVSGARGTGTFNGVDVENNRALILTNCHVVGNNSRATLDFWTNGTRESVEGRVVARYYDARKPADFALIAVDVDALARVNPPFVALSGCDGTPGENSFIISAGAPKGRFVQAWTGRTLEYFNGRTIEFKPGPVPGQSGSAIISRINGELWQTGILTWLIGTEGSDESKGGAIPISILYECLKGTTSAAHGGEVIPPGAVECSEKYEAPAIIEFTAKDCPPCRDALKDVESLRNGGARVYVYDVATTAGAEMVERYKIDRTPTWLVVDEGWNEKARCVGVGHVQELLKTFKDLQKNTAPKLDVEDFRTRAPVYDGGDAVGFFDDADNKWRDRLKNKGEEEEEEGDAGPAPVCPSCPIKKNPSTGLQGGGASALTEGVTSAINNLGGRVADGVLDVLGEKLKALRFVLLCFGAAAGAVGCFFYDVAKFIFFRAIKKPLLTMLKAYARAVTSQGEDEAAPTDGKRTKTPKNGG